MNIEQNILKQIKNHQLGNEKEALGLYNGYCNYLIEKYGPVDDDYDQNPTTRGSEWLDIHHILEYKLDDIAKRTQRAQNNKDEKSLKHLKPYNFQEQLVYANKIEHFLLHYLLASYFGQDVFNGGVNHLWDSCVALDLYEFGRQHMYTPRNNREQYYSFLSSKEITLLYKKMIDWKKWNINDCCNYWHNFEYILKYFDEQEISYIEDKDKFLELFEILGYKFNQKIKNNILTLPFRAKVRYIGKDKKPVKIIHNHIYAMDEKTVLLFQNIEDKKSFTIPYIAEKISEGAFSNGCCLEKLTIPETVKQIDDNALIMTNTIGAKLKKIIYEGSKEGWDAQFSNVNLGHIRLVCKDPKVQKVQQPKYDELFPDEELLGSWHNDDNTTVFTIQKNPNVDNLQICYNNGEYELHRRSNKLLSFFTNQNEPTAMKYYYIHILQTQKEKQTFLILSDSIRLRQFPFNILLKNN